VSEPHQQRQPQLCWGFTHGQRLVNQQLTLSVRQALSQLLLMMMMII
jgi:hypothetical protein